MAAARHQRVQLAGGPTASSSWTGAPGLHSASNAGWRDAVPEARFERCVEPSGHSAQRGAVVVHASQSSSARRDAHHEAAVGLLVRWVPCWLQEQFVRVPTPQAIGKLRAAPHGVPTRQPASPAPQCPPQRPPKAVLA